MTSPTNEQHFARVVEDLSAEFNAQFSPNLVKDVVNKFRAELEPAAKITDYLPVLVRRFAREELLAQLKGRPIAV